MALASTIVWEGRASGNATNGGGFKTGASGIDWSQQDAAQYSVTDGVTAGTTTITSATAAFGTDVVGNLIYVQGGTGSVAADWYEITARASSTSITVDRSTGLTAGTGVTLKIGGALSDVRTILTKFVSGNTVWLKNGTYTIGTGVAVNGSLQGFTVEGYGTTRGDLGTAPVIQATAAINVWQFYVYGTCIIRNLVFDGNSTGTTGLTSTNFAGASSQLQLSYCRFRRFTGAGYLSSYGGTAYFCEFDGNQYGIEQSGGAGYLDFSLYSCYIHDNSSHGIRRMTVNVFDTIFDSNGGYGIFGWGPQKTLKNCVFYNNTSGGFATEDNSGLIGLAYNCIYVSNGGWGSNGWKYFRKCAFYNNTSGAITGSTESLNQITLTALPFTDAPNGDFSLNNTASAGASCRDAGYPGAYPGALTTGYPDVGAAQYLASGGSAINIFIRRGTARR